MSERITRLKLPALARRRQIWVPTVWGWLILLTVVGVAKWVAVLQLYSFLAPTQPIGGQVLVVEAWMPAFELDQAVDVWRRGHYERVITAGGPIENAFERDTGTSYAERARNYLVQRGLPESNVIAVPSPRSGEDRTFHNAVTVRDWALRSDLALDSLDVFSSGVHSRRSWLLYRMAFGSQVRVGIFAATPSSYDPQAWWRTSAGAKEVLTEAIAWLWTELFFYPG